MPAAEARQTGNVRVAAGVAGAGSGQTVVGHGGVLNSTPARHAQAYAVIGTGRAVMANAGGGLGRCFEPAMLPLPSFHPLARIGRAPLARNSAIGAASAGNAAA